MKKSTQFFVRERAVRMVIEHLAEYPSEWATLVSIASKIGCTPEILRTWCRRQGGDTVQASKSSGVHPIACSSLGLIKGISRSSTRFGFSGMYCLLSIVNKGLQENTLKL